MLVVMLILCLSLSPLTVLGYGSGAPCKDGQIPERPPGSHFRSGGALRSSAAGSLGDNSRQYLRADKDCYEPGQALPIQLMARHLRQSFNAFVLWTEGEEGGKGNGELTAKDAKSHTIRGCPPALTHSGQGRKLSAKAEWTPKAGQRGPVTIVATTMEQSYGNGKVNQRHATLTLQRCGEQRIAAAKESTSGEASETVSCRDACCGLKDKLNSRSCEAYKRNCSNSQVRKYCGMTCCQK